jgi:hypothetical protein
MRRLFWLFLLASLAGCSEYQDEICIEGTCYDVISQASSHVSTSLDILFVVDNSGSMAGEQRQLAESFHGFASVLDERFEDYHIAVITTGMESGACPLCNSNLNQSCVNETGEHGRFQNRRGWYEGPEEAPIYQVEASDPSCKVVTRDNQDCFYDEVTGRGTVFVGIYGCGYERGLSAIRRALGKELLEGWNAGFLRDDAMLAVIVISDEDDCGEVGEVYELTKDGGNICYFASKGVGPEGETVHPDDPNQKPYQLTPVEEYKDFLMKLKGNRPGMVKFTAVTGVKDINDLSSTTIEYEQGLRDFWQVVNACNTPGCTSDECLACPGTRYVMLAQAFGLGVHGQVDTICQDDFSNTMECTAGFIACQDKFPLSKPLDGASDLSVAVNRMLVPEYTCSVQGRIEACQGPDDTSCQEGVCAPSWTYLTPAESGQENGIIDFSEHLRPCDLVSQGEIKVSVITEKE